jgi:hypothetical protein
MRRDRGVCDIRIRHVKAAAAAAAAAIAALALAGCGQQATAEPDTNTYSAHGLTVELPPGWQPAERSLTPDLGDPRERLSVGTFPLRYRPSECSHMPSSALAEIGPRDAFLTLQERGTNPGSEWKGFPARPASFGPELGDASEAAACVPDARFTDHWIWFADGDRHFHLLVAFGPEASAETRDQTWRILDSLKVDPAERPGWSASP